MAKRRFKSRGRFRKFRGGRRVRSRRLKKLIKYTVKRMSEVKYTYYAPSVGQVIGSGGWLIDMVIPEISQGANKGNRIGNRIQYKYIQFRMAMRIQDGTGAPGNPSLWRVILAWGRTNYQPSGTVPVFTLDELLDLPSTNSGGNRLYSGIRNTNFRVVFDKIYTLFGSDDPSGRGRCSAYIKKKFRTSQHVNYKISTDLIPSEPKDRLWLFIFGNNTSEWTANQNLIVSYVNRVSFLDL